jgi:ABC-2 type transport system ATP-binding protein
MTDVMIEARDLSKRYGPVTALTKASFEVRRGEVVAFLGPNGAGKSTTMKILTCFISPTEGTAKVNGGDVWDDPVTVRRSVGYLPESTPLYTEMLVYEYLDFVAKMRGFVGAEATKRIKTVIEQTSLEDVIAKEIGQLSKGFRQRVGLAQALIHEPPILILDEPMSGLDPNQASEIRELIRAIGRERTVILSTHNLAEVRLTCSRVLIIAQGELVADDTPAALAARGAPGFAVTVVAKDGDQSHSIESVRDVFGAIDGVGSVSTMSKPDAAEIEVEIMPKGREDLREDIFRTAVAKGFVLLGLERQGDGLEAVFRDLTTRPIVRDEPKKEDDEEESEKATSSENAEQPNA